MVHIYKDELDETDIKLITNEFIKVKEFKIATFGLLILIFFPPCNSFIVSA